MKCLKCQFENREGSTFCRKCGSSLKTDISCPICDALNLPDSSFCEKCGQDLTSPKKVSSLEFPKPQA
jgi:ribosomal protein L40E